MEAMYNDLASIDESESLYWTNDGHVRPLREMRLRYLLRALRIYGGDVSEVRRRTGISRSEIYRRAKLYQIDIDAFRRKPLIDGDSEFLADGIIDLSSAVGKGGAGRARPISSSIQSPAA